MAPTSADGVAGTTLPDVIRGEVIEHGFVLDNGQLLLPPFTVSAIDGTISINDTVIRATVRDPNRRRRVPSPSVVAQQVAGLENMLQGDGLIILADDGTVATVYPHIALAVLETLQADSDPRVKLETLNRMQVEGMGSWQWREIVAKYIPDPKLPARLKAMSERLRASRTPRRRVAPWILQVLTITGFGLSVVTLGALLINRPDPGSGWRGLHPDPIAVRQVFYSVALLVVVNIYDLVTTLVTMKDGHVAELNPLTAGMMDNPAQIIAVKLGATMLAAVVILSLRRHRIAQVGAWWINVVYTVLLLRWAAATSLII